MNGERYRSMITDFLLAELDDLKLNEVWFQQDGGATFHTFPDSINLLGEMFG